MDSDLGTGVESQLSVPLNSREAALWPTLTSKHIEGLNSTVTSWSRPLSTEDYGCSELSITTIDGGGVAWFVISY